MFDEQARTLLDKIRLSEAVELARSGSYSAAERLIAALPASDASIATEALDLQARICVQQGRVGEAADCWPRERRSGQRGARPRVVVAAIRASGIAFPSGSGSSCGSDGSSHCAGAR